MTVEFQFFNFWALLASILTNMIIGALWYSPLLFGNVWMKLIGRSEDDITKEDANKSMALSLVPAIVRAGVLYSILAIVNAATLLDAIVAGLALSIGFSGMTLFNNVIFEERPIKLFLLNAGYSVTSLTIASIIITFWK